MKWKLDKNRPICPQIKEQICVRIANGEFKPAERLLSVREVAALAGVNPNTVQKSFSELEEIGIISSRRGSGWYVGENADEAKEAVFKIAKEKTKAYIGDMKLLGISSEEIIKYIEGETK